MKSLYKNVILNFRNKKFLAIRNEKFLLLKFLLTAISLVPVFYLLILVSDWYTPLIKVIIGSSFFILKIVFAFLLRLIWKTLPLVLPPLIIYLSVCLFTKKKYTRVYVFMIVFSLYLIWFFKFVLPHGYFLLGALIRLPEIIFALVQIYIFTALIVPDYLVTLLGSLFFVFKSILIFILPDLPFRLDDFAIIMALFIFTFLYLNTTVFLVKRVGKIIVKIDAAGFTCMLFRRMIDGHRKK
jgi:hypothetical protein